MSQARFERSSGKLDHSAHDAPQEQLAAYERVPVRASTVTKTRIFEAGNPQQSHNNVTGLRRRGSLLLREIMLAPVRFRHGSAAAHGQAAGSGDGLARKESGGIS
jgi:hypothetical protein